MELLYVVPLGLHGIGNLHTAGHQIYVTCRWFTLVSMILHLLGVDNADEIDCQVRGR
jgi:hypothetical protein